MREGLGLIFAHNAKLGILQQRVKQIMKKEMAVIKRKRINTISLFIKAELFYELLALNKRAVDIIGQGDFTKKTEEEIELMSDMKSFYIKSESINRQINNIFKS